MDDGVVVFVQEVDVFEAERLGFGGLVFGFGVLARAEEEEIAEDAHVLGAAPLVRSPTFGGGHAVEFVDDGGVDGPDSVSWRIFSGKRLEHFADGGVQGFGDDGRGALGLVHHPDDFLADGTEVFSHSPSSSRFVAVVEIPPADPHEEDLDVEVGPLDPSEMAVDGLLLAESVPMGPLCGLSLASGLNH